MGSGPSGPDSPGKDSRSVPPWAKRVVYLHIVMTYGLVVLSGLEFVPFSLGDVPLTALIVTGLGSSVGLVLRRALALLGYDVKSGA